MLIMNKTFVTLGMILLVASLTTVAAEAAMMGRKYNAPHRCVEQASMCTGQVYRVCVAGQWTKRSVCKPSEDCMEGKGCVVSNYVPLGLNKKIVQKAVPVQKGRFEMVRSSDRQVKRTSEQVKKVQMRWKVGVGKPAAQKKGLASALVPEVKQEAASVDEMK